ncbi:collagen alpha-1(XXII) chain-like [Lingula anatina]|uniref:Collagen alpha-1(XXII) chain-like n=1 Tax=Lingula anatina TaxID=7574 RepID=A0A1S3JQ35_LINAN|nr:collagen alpha-1(XXII) chain-like [Lingula anatina]|eukprot:XP_013412460.1 collagen alpha-1(XXII) chain-like [Lingula anatina]
MKTLFFAVVIFAAFSVSSTAVGIGYAGQSFFQSTREEDTVARRMSDELSHLMAPPIFHKKYWDVIFILDSSGSIGASDFGSAKSALQSMAGVINIFSSIGPGKTRVAGIRYASWVDVQFNFDVHDSLGEVNSALGAIPYVGGFTKTRLALEKALDMYLNDGDPDNAKLIWLTTDGKSSFGYDPIAIATNLKNIGVQIFVVPVGTSVDMTEINGMGSSFSRVFSVPSYSSYRQVASMALSYASQSKDLRMPGGEIRGGAGPAEHPLSVSRNNSPQQTLS